MEKKTAISSLRSLKNAKERMAELIFAPNTKQVIKVLYKFVSYFLIIALSFESALYAYEPAQTHLQLNIPFSQQEQASASSMNHESIQIPELLGEIRQTFSGPKQKMVIHIQDAHIQHEAQIKIAGMIDYLSKKYGIRQIHVEGASGTLAHGALSTFPNSKARRLIADYLLQKNHISGPEYLVLRKRPDLILYGIEKNNLYQANRKAFLDILKFNQQDEKELVRLQTTLEALGQYVFPSDYFALYQARKLYLENDGHFLPYIEKLWKECTRLGIESYYTRIRNFITAARMEQKIQSLGQARSAKLRRQLEKLYSRLNADIFSQVESAEKQVTDAMLTAPGQIFLEKLLRFVRIHRSMLNFSLTPDDAEFFYAHHRNFRHPAYAGQLNKLLETHRFDVKLAHFQMDRLDQNLTRVETFYRLALKRDQALISKSLEKMNRDNENKIVLVTGGFHSPGIERFLKEQGYSYVSITPHIKNLLEENQAQTAYIEAIKAENPSFTGKLLKQITVPAESDPHFQLKPASLLPGAQHFESFHIRSPGDFPLNVWAQDPQMSFYLDSMIALTLTDIRLKKHLDLSVPELTGLNLTSRERILARDFYAALYHPKAFVRNEKNGNGVFISAPLGRQKLSISGTWQPLKSSRREYSTRLEKRAKLQTSDGYSTDIRILKPDERSLVEARFALSKSASVPRSEVRTTDADPNFMTLHDRQIYFPVMERASNEETVLNEKLTAVFSDSRTKEKFTILDQLLKSGIPADIPVVIRAHWQIQNPDGTLERTAQPHEQDKKLARVYKIFADTPDEGRKNFVLEISGLETGNMITTFDTYSPELNQLDAALRAARKQQAVENILGVPKVPKYSKIIVQPAPSGTLKDYILNLEGQEPSVRIKLTEETPEQLSTPVSVDERGAYGFNWPLGKENVARFYPPLPDLGTEKIQPQGIEEPRRLNIRQYLKNQIESFDQLQKNLTDQTPRPQPDDSSIFGAKEFENIPKTEEESSSVKLERLLKEDPLVLVTRPGALEEVFDLFAQVKSEIQEEGPARSEVRCGNYGGALNRTVGKMTVTEFDDLIERMAEITVIRGEQAGGEVGYLSAGAKDNQVSVRKRIVKGKRSQLPSKLRDGFKNESSRVQWVHKIKSPFSSISLPDIIRRHGHSRYGTSSAPAVIETQPHTWIPERTVNVWSVEKGNLKLKKKNLATFVSHNGDFDYWNFFGKDVAYDELPEWFQKVLYAKNPAVGDTPKVAGMMDFLFTQGMWDASLRYGFQMAVAASMKDPAPSQKTLLQWASALDQGIAQLIKNKHFVPGASLGETSGEQTEKLIQYFIRTLKEQKGIEKWVAPEKMAAFARMTVTAFLKQDLYNATRVFKEKAKGSFGLVVTSSLEHDNAVLAAHLQPLFIGFHPELHLTLWASEAAALKVPFLANGKKTHIPYRFDLNQETGEIAKINIQSGSLRIFSEIQGRELTENEISRSGRMIDMQDNPLIDPLPPASGKDIVDHDIRSIPQVLDQIRRKWRESGSHVRQTAKDFLQLVLEKDIYKRMRRALNLIRIPEAVEEFLQAKAKELALLSLSSSISEKDLAAEIKKAVFESRQLLKQEELDRVTDETLNPNGREIADILITGIEVSQWLGEQFMADLGRMFPDLKIESVSTNKILKAMKQANLHPGDREFIIEENNRRIAISKKTIVLVISQSGQTFPTLNAAIALKHIVPDRLFALTGGLDTLLGRAVGQVYAKGSPFTRRIFDNMSGFRPAETSTVASAATHATLTELLLFLGHELRERNKNRRPLGMINEKEDLEQLALLRDDLANQSMTSITGASTRGPEEKTETPLRKEILKLGYRWSQHILETGKAVGFSILIYAFLHGFLGVPDFPFGFIRIGMQWMQWAVEPGFLLNVFNFGGVLLNGLFYFLAFSYIITLGIRIVEWRFPLLARTGKRTLTIGALPYVHQILEQYVSKLFSLSYGFASLDVHGANAGDHFLHRFGHRVVRGTLSLLLLPDARLFSQSDEAKSILMTRNQQEGVQNFKVGAEVFTIGRNPKRRMSVSGRDLVLPEFGTNVQAPYDTLIEKLLSRKVLDPSQSQLLVTEIHHLAESYAGIPLQIVARQMAEKLKIQKENTLAFETEFLAYGARQVKLEQLHESRFDSFERMVSSYVLLWSIAKRVARFFRFFNLYYDHGSTQSKTRIATTSSPVPAADVIHIINQLEEDTAGGSHPVSASAPVSLPFKIETVSFPAPAEIIQPAGTEKPVEPVLERLSSVETRLASRLLEGYKKSLSRLLHDYELWLAENPEASVTEEANFLSKIETWKTTELKRLRELMNEGRFNEGLLNQVEELFQKPIETPDVLPHAASNGNGHAKVKPSAVRSEIKDNARSEVRAPLTSLVEALTEKSRIQDEIRFEKIMRQIMASENSRRALRYSLTQLADTILKSSGSGIPSPSAQKGEVVFNYRAQDASPAYLLHLLGEVNKLPSYVKLVIFRDGSTGEVAWKTLKMEIAQTGTLSNRVVYGEFSAFNTFEQFIQSRAQKTGIHPKNVIQLMSPGRLTEESVKLLQAAQIGAVPLSQGTIVVLGSEKPVANAYHLTLRKAIEISLAGMQAIMRSA